MKVNAEVGIDTIEAFRNDTKSFPNFIILSWKKHDLWCFQVSYIILKQLDQHDVLTMVVMRVIKMFEAILRIFRFVSKVLNTVEVSHHLLENLRNLIENHKMRSTGVLIKMMINVIQPVQYLVVRLKCSLANDNRQHPNILIFHRARLDGRMSCHDRNSEMCTN
jgi:hypothetical protein